MGYVKNTWFDQDVERPKTYEVTTNQDGSITLTDSFGLVTELGTPVNATNMNHIENGLALSDLMKYDATVTYSTGEWVTGVVNNEKGIYASLVDNNTGNALSDTTKWEEVQLGGLIDINTDTKLDYWTGTRAEYDAIITKDANTIYNITDDTDVTLTLLNLLYPVGSLYIASGNLSTCPLSVLGVGMWSLKTVTTLVTGVNSTAPVVGNGKALGLTNGTSNAGVGGKSNYGIIAYPELYGHNNDITDPTGTQLVGTIGITTDATKSGIEANVTSTTLAVTIWERIS